MDLDAQVAKAADLIEESLRAGNKLLVVGNAADKSHFATEFVVRFTKDRPASAATCLSGDGGLLTAVGNDYASKRTYFCSGRAPLAGSAYHKIFLTAGEIFCRSHEFYADDNCINFDEVGAFVIRPTPELINKLHS